MEQTKKKKRGNWLLTLCIIENSIILLALIVFVGRSCSDWWMYMLSTKPVPPFPHSMQVHTYPDKLVYVAGKDRYLDLSGGKVCFSEEPRDLHGFPCAYEQPGSCEAIYDMDEFFAGVYKGGKHIKDFDFTETGTYIVVVTADKWQDCAFPIEVISPDYVE